MSTDFNNGTLGFEGGKELEKALLQIEGKVRNKIARKAVRDAIKPLAARIKAAAPVDTGTLKKGIVVRTRKRGETLTGSVVASEKHWKPRPSKRSGQRHEKPLFYASFYEFGTRHQPARPFMRPTFDSSQQTMLSTVSSNLKTGIDQAAQQAPKGKG